MKKAAKLLTAGIALAAAAIGAAAYRKYQNSYEYVPEEQNEMEDMMDDAAVDVNEDSDFESVVITDDDFDYIIEDPDQIFFYE